MKNQIYSATVMLLLGVAAHSSSSADPLRLDRSVEPVTQAVELELDPAREEYSGVVRVELLFHAGTNLFRFHANELKLGRATIDGTELELQPGEASLVVARAKEVIPAGLHRFEIAFSNNYNRDGAGLYKTVVSGAPYLFTQMEATDARKSFPCWDEPSFKIPWRFTVTIPAELEAVGNMPIAAIHPTGNGKRVEFGRTPPMPSYLVALAVGPLESIPIPGQAVPGRIVTSRGQSSLAYAAAKEAPALLAELERYFGLPYPYPKLDHIGVPEFMAGAMENAGAITYRDGILLIPESASFEQKRGLASIIAHEMAHMWFGDLVTMYWWDDLWLNESFATWMSYKVAGNVHPELRMEYGALRTALAARYADTKPSVKQIRRPFGGGDNMDEAFDVLSYNKGHAILRMVEGWLGEQKFREALRRYFVRHAWGNARAEDLWTAFAESGAAALTETLRRYMEQPGLPQLSFTRLPGNRLAVQQRRYRSIIGTDVTPLSWPVPIVLRYGGAGGEGVTRFLLTREADEIALPPDVRIDWVHPNANESGYYTWKLPPDLSAALAETARKQMLPVERLGVLAAGDFSMRAGDSSPEDYLQLLLGFADDPEPEVKGQVLSSLIDFGNLFNQEKEAGRLRNLLQGVARPMLDQVGLEPRHGDSPEISSLRAQVVSALGIRANDADVIEFCRAAARRQLKDPRAVDAGIAPVTLQVASWHGDAAWLEELKKAFESASAPDIRARFRGSLTYFRDPKVARSALDYLLTEKVRSSEVLPRRRESIEPELAPVLFEWVVSNYERLKGKLPEESLPFLARFLEAGDEALLARGRAFFLDRARATPLTEVILQTAAEGVELRAALRARNARR